MRTLQLSMVYQAVMTLTARPTAMSLRVIPARYQHPVWGGAASAAEPLGGLIRSSVVLGPRSRCAALCASKNDNTA
jgi:hypothetical protein